MKPLVVMGPDSSLRNIYTLALQAWPDRQVEILHIPSTDYYRFDLSVLARFAPEEWDVCVAVNEFYINDVRRALHESVKKLGYQPTSVISPRADIDPSAVIGDNAIIQAGCAIGANTVIGHHCVLRPNVVLSEDVFLGNYVTLEASVSVREGAVIGDFTIVCANSSLARMTKIGKHCYLNLQRHYSGAVADMTFFSPVFEQPIRVLGSR